MSKNNEINNTATDYSSFSIWPGYIGFISEKTLSRMQDAARCISFIKDYAEACEEDGGLVFNISDAAAMLRVINAECRRAEGELKIIGGIFSERNARAGLDLVKQFGLEESIRILEATKNEEPAAQ